MELTSFCTSAARGTIYLMQFFNDSFQLSDEGEQTCSPGDSLQEDGLIRQVLELTAKLKRGSAECSEPQGPALGQSKTNGTHPLLSLQSLRQEHVVNNYLQAKQIRRRTLLTKHVLPSKPPILALVRKMQLEEVMQVPDKSITSSMCESEHLLSSPALLYQPQQSQPSEPYKTPPETSRYKATQGASRLRLSELRSRQQARPVELDPLWRFRRCCLKPKSRLYWDQRIEVGCITKRLSLAQIQVELYLSSCKQLAEVGHVVQINDTLKVTVVRQLPQTVLAGHQARLKMSVVLLKYPIRCPRITITGLRDSLGFKAEMLLPCVLLKFVENRRVDKHHIQLLRNSSKVKEFELLREVTTEYLLQLVEHSVRLSESEVGVVLGCELFPQQFCFMFRVGRRTCTVEGSWGEPEMEEMGSSLLANFEQLLQSRARLSNFVA